MATELAKAYVQIIPSAEGIQGKISEAMNGEATRAGQSSGTSLMGALGSAAKKAVVGLGLGKIIADGISASSEYESAMAKTSTLFTGTSEQFAVLSSDILRVSSETGMAAASLAEAAYSAESASVPMEQLGAMIESSAHLAMAGFTDVDTALSATAKTMNAYGMEGSDAMEKVQRVLIQTQNKGITTVGELGASLANVTPTAAAMGVSFEQVGAAMAQMTAQGVPTAQATTQLRSAMSELGKSGTKADKAFREAAKGTKYAGMGFKEAIASGATLGDVFGTMQEYANKSGLSMVDLWGSVEAGNAAMMIAGDLKTFNADLEAMATDADVVGEAYGKMSDTFGTSMNKLKESAKNFLTTLFQGGDISASFDAMLGNLGDIGQRLITWITNGVQSLATSLPNIMSSLLDFGGSLLESLGQVDWIQLGTTIVNGIIGALGTLGQKLIELVGNGIKALVNGDVDFGEIGTAIWNGVTSVIKTSGEWLKTLFESAVKAITGGGENGENMFSGIGDSILAGVQSILDEGGKFLADLFGFGRDAASGEDMGYDSIGKSILGGVGKFLDAGGEFLANIFKSGEERAKELGWEDLGHTIKTAVDLVLGAGDFVAAAFRAGAELVEGINWRGVGEALGKLVITGLNCAERLVEAFTGAAERLLGAIGWEDIGKGITDLVVAGLDAATKITEAFGNGAEELLNGIEWGAIGKGISDLLVAGLDATTQIVDALGTGAGDLISGIEWKEIGKGISDLLVAGLDAATSFVDTVSKASTELLNGINWNEIGKGISDLLVEGLDAATRIVDALGKGAEDLLKNIEWDAIGKGISDLLVTGMDAATSFVTTVSKASTDLIGNIEWAKVGQEISDLMSTGLKGAGTILEDAFTAAHTVLTTGIKWEEVGAAIQKGLGDVWSGLTGFIGGLFGGIGDAAQGIGTGIGTTAAAAGEWIASLFGKNSDMKQAAEDLKTAMTEMKTALEDGKTEMEKTAKSVGSGIYKSIHDEVTTVKMTTLGKQIISGIYGGIGLETPNLSEKVGEAVTTAKDAFTDEDWKGTGESCMGDVTTGFGTKAVELDTAVSKAMDNVIDKKILAKDWEGTGKSIVTSLATGFKGNKELETKAGTMMDDVDTKIKEHDFASIGSYIVAGIASGVTRNESVLMSAMTKLANKALAAAKETLKIKSPSQVFRDEVGRMIVSGIETGIIENAGGAISAAESLTDQLVYTASNGAQVLMDTVAGTLGTEGGVLHALETGTLHVDVDSSGAAAQSTGEAVAGVLQQQAGTITDTVSGKTEETLARIEEKVDGWVSKIRKAMKDGMEAADIDLYMDGRKVSEKVSEYLGDVLTARRFSVD